mmetsp:Transcript_26016/g.36603  ORF Transcript_26016/g.36603 Transcript_26016/m.36603 type:complete len:286 (-) Transcript_26016:379-1236(-)
MLEGSQIDFTDEFRLDFGFSIDERKISWQNFSNQDWFVVSSIVECQQSISSHVQVLILQQVQVFGHFRLQQVINWLRFFNNGKLECSDNGASCVCIVCFNLVREHRNKFRWADDSQLSKALSDNISGSFFIVLAFLEQDVQDVFLIGVQSFNTLSGSRLSHNNLSHGVEEQIFDLRVLLNFFKDVWQVGLEISNSNVTKSKRGSLSCFFLSRIEASQDRLLQAVMGAEISTSSNFTKRVQGKQVVWLGEILDKSGHGGFLALRVNREGSNSLGDVQQHLLAQILS